MASTVKKPRKKSAKKPAKKIAKRNRKTACKAAEVPVDAARSLEPANISCSRGLAEWLVLNNCSLALSSYQTGQLYLIGVQADGRLSFHQIGLPRAMGLWADQQRLILATQTQVIRFENVLNPSENVNGADAFYIPRMAHTTGDLDIHDIVVRSDGVIVFANTLFSCLSMLHPVHSFKPVWAPPFISRLVAEDRCHLNGIALKDGNPAYTTATSRADVVSGWRARREAGGCVMDVANNTIISEKLSMPHSPRWHDGQLWVLNSGSGHLGTVDLASGNFELHTFLPGFVRGLAFHHGHAIVGLSLPRDGNFAGLELDGELERRDADPWCGVQIINLATGGVTEWIRFETAITELLDVCVIPNVRLPGGLAPSSPELVKFHTIDPAAMASNGNITA